MNLLEQFKSFVQSNHLLAGDQPSLLAVSGGVDSVVMAQLFRESGFPFGIAHCNFQLRGAESDADEHFVQQLAAAWAVPFFVKHFETKTYAAQNGLSIQMAARELRYAWFREITLENGFARLATAHNLNDSVETALLNFIRGTGLSGMKGIAVLAATPPPTPTEGEARYHHGTLYVYPSRNLGRGAGGGVERGKELNLIRPLLFATRSEIESWARSHQLGWREDSSNITDDYARNFLRHRVVPLLEELNPNFLHTAARNLARLRETGDNLDFLLDHFLGKAALSEDEYHIDKQKLVQLPAPRRALREILKQYGFTEEQARQVAENLDHTGLELRSGTGWRLLNDRENILLVRAEDLNVPTALLQTIQSDDLMIALPGGGRLILMHTEVAPSFPDGRESILVDAEKLRFPLLLRPWKPGDVFQPFGMNGHSQKLQDFFTNLKLSRIDKEKVRVLENGDGAIVWIVGYRPDERFRVTPETSKFLKITYL